MSKPKTAVWILAAVTLAFGVLTIIRYGMTLAAIKGLILLCILLYASKSDIDSLEVPDFVWAMLLILSFVDFSSVSIPSRLIGAAAVFLPQFVFAMLFPAKAFGGADMKISAAAAFCLGAGKGILALIIGLSIAVVFIMIARKVMKKDKDEPFPLVPFLSVGIIAAYFM